MDKTVVSILLACREWIRIYRKADDESAHFLLKQIDDVLESLKDGSGG